MDEMLEYRAEEKGASSDIFKIKLYRYVSKSHTSRVAFYYGIICIKKITGNM